MQFDVSYAQLLVGGCRYKLVAQAHTLLPLHECLHVTSERYDHADKRHEQDVTGNCDELQLTEVLEVVLAAADALAERGADDRAYKGVREIAD